MEIIKSLNICFDGRMLRELCKKYGDRTGIYHVSKRVVQEFVKKKEVVLYLYFDSDSEYIDRIIEDLHLGIDRRTRILFSDSDFSQIDAFFSPVFPIPKNIDKYPKISQYTILYDVTPLLFSKYFPQGCAKNFLSDKNVELSRYKYYFAISAYTKQDFLKYFPQLDEMNMDVIPLSTNQEYQPNKNVEQLEKVKNKYHIPQGKKYLFSLCSLEPRKNLIRVVRSFLTFIEKNHIEDLIFVLGGCAWAGFIERLEKEVPDYEKYKDKIIRSGYVEDEDLEILYSNAEWFVYTSEYEGFGMPPLEAMRCGCPVITSNNSSLPEVVGDAGIMIDFDSDEQHIEAYEKYYFDENLRKANSQKGIERAKLFSWESAVDIILHRMQEVEERKRQKPLVTIITATHNLIKNGREKYFIQNLESVQNQTYKNIEHIVIDGASNDGTIELLEKYQQKGWIKYYSEPDRGIYDAMNKGILKANGKYVVCLNSDDYYCDINAVEWEVMKLEELEVDACYANANVIRKNEESDGDIWRGDKNFFPLFGLFPKHQTLMVKKDVLLEDNLFRLDISSCADNVFMLNLKTHHKKCIFLDKTIVCFREGGWSSTLRGGEVKNDYVNYLFQSYGQYHRLTKLDCDYLFDYEFLKMPLNDAVKLGNKIEVPEWREEYFRVLTNHCTFHPEKKEKDIVVVQPKIERKCRILGFFTLWRYTQDSRNKKWYLCGVPLFRIKQKNDFVRKYYIFAIPVLKVIEK